VEASLSASNAVAFLASQNFVDHFFTLVVFFFGLKMRGDRHHKIKPHNKFHLVGGTSMNLAVILDKSVD
jgi:hypothetical protein